MPITPFRFILHMASGPYRWWFVTMIVCEALNAVSGISLPYALGRIIGAVTAGRADPDAVVAVVWWPVTLFALLCLGELVFGRINGAIQLRVAPRQRQMVAKRLFHHLMLHSHRFLTENFSGALAHRIGEASHGVNMVLWALITEFWPIAIIITVANILLLATNPWLGLFTLSWSVGFIVVSFVLARRTQPLAFAASSARSRTVGHIVDTVGNHASVRLFARLDHERQRLDRTYAGELDIVLTANGAMERVRLFQFAASAVLKAGVVVLAVVLWHRGVIGVGQFVMAVSLALLVIAEVRNLSRRFLDFFESLGNVSSGVKAIVHAHELVDRPGARVERLTRGAIRFEGVDFRYGEGEPVFRGLAVDIPAGQRVGLVGLSGSGKSTFVSLLLRLYDVQAGAIRIDGHDLRDLSQDALHAQVGLIPQDPTLFHRTMRDNIRYGRPEADDAAVESAAQRALAHEFIERIPEGYDALVGERGVKLSGGQRQRIAIARVILKDAPVLILDEATSSLDSITERAIQEALDRVMVGKTVIVVAHRLSTIAHLDRILVFERGRIVEDGSHHALLARHGIYFRLWSRQTDGVLPDGGEPSESDPASAAPAGTPDPGDTDTTSAAQAQVDDAPAPSSSRQPDEALAAAR